MTTKVRPGARELARAILPAFIFWTMLAGCGGAQLIGLGEDDAATSTDGAGGPDARGEAATDAAHDDATAPVDARADVLVDSSRVDTGALDATADTSDARLAAESGLRDVGPDALDSSPPEARAPDAMAIDAEGTDGTVPADALADVSVTVLETGSGDAADAADAADAFVAVPPDPPTGVIATAGDGFVDVSWTAPNDHGSAITLYTVRAASNLTTTMVTTTGATTARVSGLVDGTLYAITVTASNAGGTSTASSPAATATPAGVPSAPTITSALAGNASVTVTWTAPASDHGSPVTSYTVTTSPADVAPATSTASPFTVTGLTNGTLYTFTVVAHNAVGASAASPPMTATPSGAPGAPVIVSVVPGDMSATVTWTAPVNNGDPITGYAVTSSPGGITAASAGSATSVVVSGLTNCTSYTFTVIAANGRGLGAPSAPSPAVVPGPVATISYMTNVQPIFTNNCVSCHGGSGGLTITYANIVTVTNGEGVGTPLLDYVAPGDPGHSYLWCKVNPTDAACSAAATVIAGVRMPASGPPYLSAPDLATIKTWIQECAHNN